MTQPVDIEALRQLMERATAGPWEVVPYGDGDSLVIHDARGDWRVCFMATPGSNGDMSSIRANAATIVALRNNAEALLTELEALRAERGRMENGLKVAEDAMREMFRYYDGGETRGSYDGKPERNGLRKAWHEVRSTLSTLKEPSQ